MWWILLAAIVWIVCGVLGYGLVFAHLQREYPALAAIKVVTDRVAALIVLGLGPCGLIAALMAYGTKHGLKFRFSERIERCEKE